MAENDNNKKVLVKAYSIYVGKTNDGLSSIHTFYLFVNDKHVCDNSSFTLERYKQLANIYESQAMVVGMALEALGMKVETVLDFS